MYLCLRSASKARDAGNELTQQIKNIGIMVIQFPTAHPLNALIWLAAVIRDQKTLLSNDKRVILQLKKTQTMLQSEKVNSRIFFWRYYRVYIFLLKSFRVTLPI